MKRKNYIKRQKGGIANPLIKMAADIEHSMHTKKRQGLVKSIMLKDAIGDLLFG